MRVLFERRAKSRLRMARELLVEELERLQEPTLYGPEVQEYLGFLIQFFRQSDSDPVPGDFTLQIVLAILALDKDKQRVVRHFIPSIVGTLRDVRDGAYSDFFLEVQTQLESVFGFAGPTFESDIH